jgi:AraC-like DNA-binding protein
MSTKSTVSQNLVYGLLHYTSTLGMDPFEVCGTANIPFPINMDPGARIPASRFYSIWTEVIEQAGDLDFGLHYAAFTRKQPSRDILTAVMFNCPTVGAAMEILTRYHDLATDLIQIRIQEQGETVHYAWVTPLEGILDRHISEAVIAWLFFTLQELTNQSTPIHKVHFRHPEPASTIEHQKIFNCQIAFEQPENEIIIAHEVLDFLLPLADPRIIQHLEAILQEQLNELYPSNTWAEQVSQYISQMLLQGEPPKITTAAKEFALSTRQLQNKLKSEGTSYRKLLEQVRKEMSLRYLKEPDVNLYDIAFLLGFSDQSAFTHAFKRWTGSSPGEYRGAN